jgi:hypothetical protein
VSSCKEDDENNEQPQEPALTVDIEAIDTDDAGGTYSVAVTSNTGWKAAASGDFVSLASASGTGNGAFVITVAANTVAETRTANVTVTASNLTKTITVTQAGKGELSVTPSPVSQRPNTGGAITFTVKASVAWAATLTTGGDFVSIAPAAGAGNTTTGETFTATIAPNSPGAPERAATLTVTAGSNVKAINIRQAAGDARALSVAAPQELGSVPTAGATYSVAVTSNTDWTVTAADFITATPTEGTGNGAFILTIPAYEETTNRNGTVTVAATDTVCSFSVVQLGAGVVASLEVDPVTVADVPAAGTTQAITVTANAGWTVAIAASSSFLTASATEGNESGSFNITVAPNATAIPRSGTVTVISGSIVREIAVTQNGVPVTLTVKDPNQASSYTMTRNAHEHSFWNIMVASNTIVTATILDSPDWIRLGTGLSGEDYGYEHSFDVGGSGHSDNFGITFNVSSENTSVEPRIARFEITALHGPTITVTFRQNGVAATMALPTTSIIEIGAAETGEYTVPYQSNSTVTAALIGNADWITVPKTEYAPGSGNVSYTVNSENGNNTSRSAQIAVTALHGPSATLTVTQAGQVPPPTLTITSPGAADSYTITKEAGASGAGSIAFQSNATVTAAISGSPGWISISGIDYTGGEPGAGGVVNYTLSANTTPVKRAATITITADNGTETKTQAVTLRQGADISSYGITLIEHGGAQWADRNLKAKGQFADTPNEIGHDFVSELQHVTDKTAFDAICPDGFHLPSRAEVSAAKANGLSHNHASDINQATEVTLTDASGHKLVLPICSQSAVAGHYGVCGNGGGVYLGNAEDGYYGFTMFVWGVPGSDFGYNDRGQAWQRYARCVAD